MFRKARKGFTLPEVLVTVAIVSVLAAVVVPSVITSISKADQPSMENSLKSIQTSLTTFVSDVRKFPAAPRPLLRGFLTGTAAAPSAKDSTIAAPSASTSSGSGSPFVSSDSARYKGPYLAASLDSLHLLLPDNFVIDRFRIRATSPASTDASNNDCRNTVMAHVRKYNATTQTFADLDSTDILRLEVLMGDIPNAATLLATDTANGQVRYTNLPANRAASVAICLLPYSTQIF